MSKKQNPIDQIQEFNQRLTDFTLRLSKAFTGSMAPAIRAQADIAAESMERAVEVSEKILKIKSPEELVKYQKEFAEELSKNFQANVQKLIETQKSFGEEMQKLLQDGQKAYDLETFKSMFGQK